MSIYITGDGHGDYRRFSMKRFPEQKEMTKDDCVIICGDRITCRRWRKGFSTKGGFSTATVTTAK